MAIMLQLKGPNGSLQTVKPGRVFNTIRAAMDYAEVQHKSANFMAPPLKWVKKTNQYGPVVLEAKAYETYTFIVTFLDTL
jgi:hypothetical protein